MSRLRIAGLLASIAILSLAAPVAAVQPEGSCGSERGAAFTMPLPDAMRTTGTHRFEYRISLILPDGTADVAFTENQIDVAAGAPLYRNVMLRLVRNRGILADGTVDFDVQVMDPAQPAAFYAQISFAREFDAIVATTTMEVRWEGRRNHWSDWAPLARGPITSLCPQLKDSILIKSYGWAG